MSNHNTSCQVEHVNALNAFETKLLLNMLCVH